MAAARATLLDRFPPWAPGFDPGAEPVRGNPTINKNQREYAFPQAWVLSADQD